VLHADDTKFVLGVATALPTTSAATIITANAEANEYLIDMASWLGGMIYI